MANPDLDSKDSNNIPISSNVSVMDVSSSQDSEPSTQPLMEDNLPESSQEAMDIEDNPAVYGFLLPLRPHGPRIKLEDDAFTVGRSLKNSYKVLGKQAWEDF